MRAFIAEDEIAINVASPSEGFTSVEAQELVRSVLTPWRGQRLRRIAQMYVAQNEQRFGELFVLRTYYGGGATDDEKLREWLEQADPDNESLGGPDGRYWRVLDDAALFDMGSEKWQRIYDTLPEMAAPGASRTFGDDDVDAVRELVAAPGDEREPEEDDYEEAVMATAAISAGFLLIVDQQAFEDGEFGLVFRDAKGNIIKEGSIKPEEVEYLLAYNSRGALSESEYWVDAAVGDKYKTRGEVMSSLLPVVMSEAE